MNTLEAPLHISQVLKQMRHLPTDPKTERVVMWKVFRHEDEALQYSQNILLESDQCIVGGHSTDSAGHFFWLGVQVEDLATWGHTQAIQLTEHVD